MNCPRCQHENPPQVKFCLECATPLALRCSNCGTQLPASAKFCLECACAVGGAIRTLGVQIRAGLHTGECQITGDKVGGLAVHIGARVAAMANPGEVLV